MVSEKPALQKKSVAEGRIMTWANWGMAVLALVVFGMVGSLASQTVVGQAVVSKLTWLFATDSVQLWWFVTRASAIIAYLLLWLSTIWGLVVPSKLLDPLLERTFTFDFHQFISLLSIGFTLLHILVLTVDRYLPYSIPQLLIPFLSPYRPFWVGLGVLSFYIIVLVTVTFYMRGKIGMSAFRAIHIFSLLGYAGVTLHGLFAGTDSPLATMKFMYIGTSLVAAFLTAHYLWGRFQKKQQERQAAIQAHLHRHNHKPVHYARR